MFLVLEGEEQVDYYTAVCDMIDHHVLLVLGLNLGPCHEFSCKRHCANSPGILSIGVLHHAEYISLSRVLHDLVYHSLDLGHDLGLDQILILPLGCLLSMRIGKLFLLTHKDHNIFHASTLDWRLTSLVVDLPSRRKRLEYDCLLFIIS